MKARSPNPSVDLACFENSWYSPGRGIAIRSAWLFLSHTLFRARWLPGSRWRRELLRIFGARIGTGVVIKPGVYVKYPWRLELGDNCWVGEEVWIDNVGDVSIGPRVCVSQGVYLCTGNHDYKDRAFKLIVGKIVICDGAWIGAMSVICPDVTIGACAVVGMGSVVSKPIGEFEIHMGNPARLVRMREIR